MWASAVPGQHMWASAGQGQSLSSPKQWKSDGRYDLQLCQAVSATERKITTDEIQD